MEKLTINTNVDSRTPLGTDHECKSPEELHTMLSAGVNPSRILFSDERRSALSLRLAARSGVDALLADSHEDLMKIAAHHPRARLVLRVNASKSHEDTPHDLQFQDATEVAADMLEEATALGLTVAGIRFHVGSDLETYEVYTETKDLLSPVHVRSPVYLRSPVHANILPPIASSSPRVAVV